MIDRPHTQLLDFAADDRRAGFRLLCRHYHDHVATGSACEVALEEDHPGRRLAAAIWKGGETLVRVASQTDPHSVPPDLWSSDIRRVEFGDHLNAVRELPDALRLDCVFDRGHSTVNA